MTKILPGSVMTFALLVATVLSESPASATLLSDFMVTHGSIQQGNAVFSNIVATPNFIGVDPSNVDVQGESIGGQDGLSFVFVGNALNPTFQFLASSVGGGTHERAIEIQFDVTTITQQFLLHGITQSATGMTSQISPGIGYYASSTQAFVSPNPVAVLALSVTSPPQPFNPNGTNTGSLPADQSALHVLRQVQVLAGQVHGAGEGTAELTSFDVVFSETVLPPPPAAWTGASSTSWTDSGNWSGGVPGATTTTTNADTALFNQTAAHSPVTIDAGRNLQNITFDTAGVNSLTVGAVDGQILLLTAGGTLQTTSTVATSQAVNAPLRLAGNYTFNSGASSNSAALSIDGRVSPSVTAGTTALTLSGGNTGPNTIGGVLADNGAGKLAVTKNGSGLWILSGANTYSGGTVVLGGTLKFDINSGAPAIASGVTGMVASGATLELAGSISALGTTGGNRVDLVNDSMAFGLVVSGTNQVVGAIDGAGNTQVNAGSELTANHIIQNALIIGGAAGSAALLTIDASDASGNPLGQSGGLALARPLTPNHSFGAGSFSAAELSRGGSEQTSLSASSSVGGGNPSSVPEPSTLLLVLLALAGLAGQGIALRRRARRNDH